ncbi:hypothetical protein IWX47DRAFT_208133 [Phyllosticta citricarpa]
MIWDGWVWSSSRELGWWAAHSRELADRPLRRDMQEHRSLSIYDCIYSQSLALLLASMPRASRSSPAKAKSSSCANFPPFTSQLWLIFADILADTRNQSRKNQLSKGRSCCYWGLHPSDQWCWDIVLGLLLRGPLLSWGDIKFTGNTSTRKRPGFGIIHTIHALTVGEDIYTFSQDCFYTRDGKEFPGV